MLLTRRILAHNMRQSTKTINHPYCDTSETMDGGIERKRVSRIPEVIRFKRLPSSHVTRSSLSWFLITRRFPRRESHGHVTRGHPLPHPKRNRCTSRRCAKRTSLHTLPL